MTNDFFAELARCLHKKEIDSVIQKDRRLEVILHGQPALFVTPRNEVFLLPEMSGSEEANDLYHEVAQAADEVFSYVEAVQTAPLLHVSGLSEEFHQLADYYEDDFQSAKQDFAVRSGLISKAQLFSEEELTELYRATGYQLENDPEIHREQFEALQAVRAKIEYAVPDVQEKLEQEQNLGQQMN